MAESKRNEINPRIEVYSAPGSYDKQNKRTAVALGYFDGVHTGHRTVLERANAYAQQHGLTLAVFTFTIPQGGGMKGRQLLSPEQKHEKLAEIGAEICFEPPFASFSALTPEQFFQEMLLGEFGAKALFCGDDFAFGAGRAGNTKTLKKMCAEAGIHLEVLPVVSWQGEEVSSTRIRKALENGDMAAANAMLGYPYEIDFPVQHGQQLGSTLGFPTINQIFPPERQAPAQGVYITQTEVDGRLWPSATGYGVRPTVNGSSPTCETFIPGYSGDLYERRIKVRFYKKIADTTKFASIQELTQAVHAWAKQAVEYFDA